MFCAASWRNGSAFSRRRCHDHAHAVGARGDEAIRRRTGTGKPPSQPATTRARARAAMSSGSRPGCGRRRTARLRRRASPRHRRGDGTAQVLGNTAKPWPHRRQQGPRNLKSHRRPRARHTPPRHPVTRASPQGRTSPAPSLAPRPGQIRRTRSRRQNPLLRPQNRRCAPRKARTGRSSSACQRSTAHD